MLVCPLTQCYSVCFGVVTFIIVLSWTWSEISLCKGSFLSSSEWIFWSCRFWSWTLTICAWTWNVFFQFMILSIRCANFDTWPAVLINVIRARPRERILLFGVSVFCSHCETCECFRNGFIIQLIVSRSRNVLIFWVAGGFDSHCNFGAWGFVGRVILTRSGNILNMIFVSTGRTHFPTMGFISRVFGDIIITGAWNGGMIFLDLGTVWSFGHGPSRRIPKRTHRK